MEGHRQLLEIRAFFGEKDRLRLEDLLLEVQPGLRLTGHGGAWCYDPCFAIHDGPPTSDREEPVERVPREAAVPAAVHRIRGREHVEGRSGGPLPDDPLRAGGRVTAAINPGDPERVAGVFRPVHHMGLAGVRASDSVGILRHDDDLAGHDRHRLAGEGNQRRDRRPDEDLAVGQRAHPGSGRERRSRARVQCRRPVEQAERRRVINVTRRGSGHGQPRPRLEHVVVPPVLPHPLGEMGVEVAVEDRVPGRLVPVPRSAEVDLVGVPRARADPLGVEVVRVVVVCVEEPLVVVEMEDVLLFPRVEVAEHHPVVHVAVVDVRRVIRVKGEFGLRAGRPGRRRLPGFKGLEPHVRRRIHQHRRVPHRERGEEELLVGAGQAVVHRSHAEAVRDDLGADPARPVVDQERIPHPVEGVAEHRVIEERRERLGDGVLVVEDDGELPERLEPVRNGRVALPYRFQRVGGRREILENASTLVGDDRVQVGVDDLVGGRSEVEGRESCLPLLA